MPTKTKLAVLFSIAVLVTTIGAAADLQMTTVDSDGDRLSGVTIKLRGPADLQKTTNSQGRVEFHGIPDGSYEVTVSADGYEKREFDTRLYTHTQQNLTVALQRTDDTGTIRVHVEGQSGADRAGVRVIVEHQASGERFAEHTNEDGISTFDGIPIGEYEVFIDDDEYESDTATVDVTSGRTSQVQLTTQAQDTVGDRVQVRQIVVPDTIRQQTPFTVEVQVQNMQNTTVTGVEVSVTALDTRKRERITITGNGTEWVSFEFSPGVIERDQADIQVAASDAGETDRETITVPVGRWAAFMNIEPSDVTVGEPAYIQGRVEDAVTGAVGRNIVAALYFDGEFLTNVVTDSTGRFSAFVRPETAGTHEVVLKSQTIYQRGVVRATPEITIWTRDSEGRHQTVANSVAANVCFTVRLQGIDTVDLIYYIDGTVQKNTSATIVEVREFCYDIPTQQAGEHTALLRAQSAGASDSFNITYTVREPITPIRINTTNASIDVNVSEIGEVETLLINPTQTDLTVNVSLTGLDASWINRSEHQVTVPANGNITVSFIVRPGDNPGDYSPSIMVEDDGATRSQEFSLTVRKGVQKSIRDTLRRGLRRNWEALAVVILLLVIGYIVRRDVKQWLSPQSLEPQQR